MADKSPFEETYPALALWVKGYGWIEIGDDGMNRPFIRILDEGGIVWEGSEYGADLAVALMTAESALCAILLDQFGVDVE